MWPSLTSKTWPYETKVAVQTIPQPTSPSTPQDRSPSSRTPARICQPSQPQASPITAENCLLRWSRDQRRRHHTGRDERIYHPLRQLDQSLYPNPNLHNVCAYDTGRLPLTGGIAITPDQAPISSFIPSVNWMTVFFDGGDSISPIGGIAEYIWDFGDGSPPTTTTIPTISHTYANTGMYEPSLTVVNGAGTSLDVTYTGKEISNPRAAKSSLEANHRSWPLKPGRTPHPRPTERRPIRLRRRILHPHSFRHIRTPSGGRHCAGGRRHHSR